MKELPERIAASKQDRDIRPVTQFNSIKNVPKWQSHYWVVSFLVGMFLYSFEAVQIMFFEHFRAPNVRLITQLFLTFVFYALWAIVPRIIWFVFGKAEAGNRQTLGYSAVCLAFTGLALSLLHLTFLALMKLDTCAHQINNEATERK